MYFISNVITLLIIQAIINICLTNTFVYSIMLVLLITITGNSYKFLFACICMISKQIDINYDRIRI